MAIRARPVGREVAAGVPRLAPERARASVQVEDLRAGQADQVRGLAPQVAVRVAGKGGRVELAAAGAAAVRVVGARARMAMARPAPSLGRVRRCWLSPRARSPFPTS